MAKLKDGFYKLTAEAVGSNSYMLLAGGGSKALSDFATASGVVTALGTNGNYVTWTKNGTANNLTVPYATNADTLDGLHSNSFFKTTDVIPDTSVSWSTTGQEARVGPVGSALCDPLKGNRFAGIKAEAITVEYSTNAGTSWIDYGASNDEKRAFFTQFDASFVLGKNTDKNTSNNNYRLRVTVDCYTGWIYTSLYKGIVYVSSEGSTNCKVTVQVSNDNASYTDKGTYKLSGWSGYNEIGLVGITADPLARGNGYYRYIRFLFSGEYTKQTSNYYGLRIIGIEVFGGIGWTLPNSNIAKYGRPYTYDYLGVSRFGNSILPEANNSYNLGSDSLKWANVYSTNFIGNATTADRTKYLETQLLNNTNWYGDSYKAYLKWETSNIVKLKIDGYYTKVDYSVDSDTVDGYHVTKGNNKPWGTIPAITTGGYMDVGKHFEFHYDNTTGSDYSTALMCTGNHGNVVNLPSTSGTLALTSQIPTSLPANGGNADTVDNLHASDFVKITPKVFSLYKKGIWTKILTFTITNNSLDPSISFSWHPTECARSVWADFNINIRTGGILFMGNWKGSTIRTLKCVGDGTTYDVWVSGTKDSYDPFGAIQVTSTYKINSYNTGSLAYQDTEPTGTYNANVSNTTISNYANSAGNADTLDNIHANGLLTALSSNTTNAVSITVGGTTKNITAATLKTSLGLGSNAYTSTAYLPLTGGTLSGDLYFNHTNTETRGYIGWIQGSYHERLQINDGDTDGASTFTFLISRDKGSTWKDLLQIKNNSTIVATTFLGKLAYTNLTGSGTTANLAIVSTGTANGWTLKTLGSRAFDSTAYLPLAGGTMTNDATIKFNATGGIIQTTATTSNATNLITWYKGTTKDDNYSHPAQIGWHNTGDTNGAIYLIPHPQDTAPWEGSVGLYISKASLKYNNNNLLKAIKSITRSGTTFTYTCIDGTTGTFTLLDNNSTYAVYGKTINASYKTAYRTLTKGNTTNGYYISAIRCDAASVSEAPLYGSGIAFGMGDTHGYLYMNYFTANAYIGGGNADKLNWTATLLHSGNSSVSKSGQTLTVKINGVEQSLTNTTYSSLKNPNAIKFKNTSGTTITYDGSSAADLTAGVNYASSSYTASLLSNTSIASGTNPSAAASGQYVKWYSHIGYSSGYAGNNYGFPVNSNANGILWMGTHSGPYGGLLGISSNSRIYYRFISGNSFPTTANGGSWYKVAWTNDIPTKTSQLTNDSGYLTQHQSLSNYVTLNGTQTITGVKTFSTQQKFTVAQGTSPFTVTSTTKVSNLNSDLLDGYDSGRFLRAKAWVTNPGLDADTLELNMMCFTYSNNAPHTGTLIYFAGATGGSYGLLLNASYSSSGYLSFRSRNGDSGTWKDWSTILTLHNYTSYVNTTNFAGLHKTGTVTSVTVTGANGLSGSGTITTSGTITLSNAGVRSTTIHGNYLRINTNGTNADLTIPYSTTASLLNNTSVSDPSTAASGQNVKWYSQINNSSGYAGTNYGFPVSNNANGILWLGTHSGPYGWLMGFSSNGRIYARYISNNSFSTTANGGSWNRIAWTSDIPTVTNYYWANVKISSSSNEATTPTFSTITTTGVSYVATLRPSTTETHYLGSANNRWNGVFSKAGNFSGLITLSVATGTSPFKITSTTVNTNLNADMLDGKHASDFATSGHTHSYVSLSGSTMNENAVISRTGPSVSWYQGRVYPIIKTTSYTGYNAILSMKTTNGSWDLGVYSNDTAYLTYISDTNYSSSTNTTTYQLTFPKKTGTLAVTSDIPANTWRGITDSYSGTDSTISLSQKGGNALYNALVNGYASSAGNAETVDGYHIWVGSSSLLPGTKVNNTIYIII